MSKARKTPALRESYRLKDETHRRVVVFGNGLTVVLHRHDAAPVVAVRVYVRGGSAFEGPWLGSGISHLFEHAITCDGTARRSERELVEISDAIGGLSNAYTSVDHICHHVTTARENLAHAVEVFADFVTRPLLSKAVFERELGVVQRELERDRDDPDVQLDELLHETIYSGHPLQHPVIGHRNRLLELTHEDILAYHRKVHAADNIVVVIAGDIDLDAAQAIVARAFEGLSRRGAARASLPDPAPVVTAVTCVKPMDVESASAVMAWQTVRETHADEPAIDLLCSVLTEGAAARVAKALVWDSGLAFDLGGSHETTWHSPGLFQISFQCDAKQVEKAREQALGVLAALEERPITEVELRRALRQNENAILYQRETAEGLAAQLGEDFLAGGDIDYADAFLASLRRVTSDDLMRVAARYLKPDACVTAVVVPRARPARAVRQRRVVRRREVVRAALPNGLRIAIRPMSSSRFVAVNAFFRGGLVAETPSTNGAFHLLSRVWHRGSRGHTADQIEEEFSLRGSALRATSGMNQFGIGFVAPADEWDALFPILAEVLVKPLLSAEEIEKARPSLLDAVARIDEDWNGELTRFVRAKFFKNSPYRMMRIGTEANLRRFGPAHLRRIHGRYVAGRNGVLSIAGEVNPRKALGLIRSCLKDLPRGSAHLIPRPRFEPPPSGDRLFVKRSSGQREAAGVFIGYPGLTAGDRKYRAAVALIETMLSGYALSGGRLFSALRSGTRDMAYEVTGAGFTGLWPGYIAFVAACEPKRMNEVYRLMRAEIDAVRDGRFDADELERARAMIVAGELDQLQSAGDYSSRMGVDEVFGLGAEDAARFLEEVRSVSLAAARRSAQRFLQHATVGVVTPDPRQVRLGMRAAR